MPLFRTINRSELIEPPQPLRIAMDEGKLNELAESLRQFGMILPIAVCVVDGKHEIIDGHRRFIAAGIAGLDAVPVAIFENVAQAKYGMMLHANIMREDVTAAEEGFQFVELVTKEGWDVDQLCKFIGRGRGYVDERAKLVTEFQDVAEHVASRAITWAQAKVVMREKKPERRAYLIDQVITSGATSRQLNVLVDSFAQQDRLAATGVNDHATEMQQTYASAESPVCIWCGRDDDPFNLQIVYVHSYHKRDMEAVLARLNPVQGPA